MKYVKASPQILIPNPSRKRALIVVDMQAGFLKEIDKSIISHIQHVIQHGEYSLFVEAIFHAEKGSLWDKQTNWTFKLEPTISEIKKVLNPKNPILVTKTAKSVFSGDKNLVSILKEHAIEEVHLVGVDTNDCILATANDSFDAGFFTYVIEECVGSSSGPALHKHALAILRNVDLTNHSLLIKSVKGI